MGGVHTSREMGIGGEVGTNRELELTELLAAEAERHGGAPVVAGGDEIGSGTRREERKE
jgi:hypothetical protein